MRAQLGFFGFFGVILGIFLAYSCANGNADNPSTGGPGGDACGAGSTRCNAQCVNLGTDRANCGACGKVCSDSQSCSAGTAPAFPRFLRAARVA
jgi:hypothetical protein